MAIPMNKGTFWRNPFFFAILRRTIENDLDFPFNSRMLVWFVRKDLESRGNLNFYNDI